MRKTNFLLIDVCIRRLLFYFSTVLLSKRLKYVKNHFLRGCDIRGTKKLLDIVLHLQQEKDRTPDKAGYRRFKEDFDELIKWLDVRKELVGQ